jgi:hypothetical protein
MWDVLNQGERPGSLCSDLLFNFLTAESFLLESKKTGEVKVDIQLSKSRCQKVKLVFCYLGFYERHRGNIDGYIRSRRKGTQNKLFLKWAFWLSEKKSS